MLRTVVSHLEAINLNKTDLDVKGVAFEQFMDGFFKGDFGQYFTPRPIIEFCVKMMKPEQDWDVLDIILQSLIQRTGKIKKCALAV